MKLLVTGANGYLGSSLCPLLLKQGGVLTTLTRRPWLLEGARNSPVDMDDEEALRQSVAGQDVVIHLAALAHQPGRQNPAAELLYWRVNVEQTQRLAQLALAAGVKRFIYISSIKVNGEASITPYRFDSPPRPEDSYGRSKWAAEQSLAALCCGSAMELVVIRPPLIWGGAMKGNLALLQALVRRGIPLPFAALNNRRDLVSLPNLCSLISLVTYHPRAAGQTLLVSDGIARSTADIVRLLAVPQGRPVTMFSCPRWLFKLMARMPWLGAKLNRLTGNLEVDIKPTCDLLDWQPTDQRL